MGETWYQLIVAALIGVVMAQLGFLSHEAAHQEIFASRAWNEWASRVSAGLLVGLSYGWWVAKHNSHHAHPNQEGADPDLDSTALAFTPDASDRRPVSAPHWLSIKERISSRCCCSRGCISTTSR